MAGPGMAAATAATAAMAGLCCERMNSCDTDGHGVIQELYVLVAEQRLTVLPVTKVQQSCGCHYCRVTCASRSWEAACTCILQTLFLSMKLMKHFVWPARALAFVLFRPALAPAGAVDLIALANMRINMNFCVLNMPVGVVSRQQLPCQTTLVRR
jgi:hypothetical protein